MSAPLPPLQKRRGNGPGCFLALALLVAVYVALDFIGRRVDEYRFPWAYARPGRSTLTGHWAGVLVTGGGARLGFYLDLRLESLDKNHRRGRAFRSRGDKLEGEARLCSAPGRIQLFELSGNNTNRDATAYRISLSVIDSTVKDGFAPSHLRGTWDGRDALTMEADVHLRRGPSAISNSADPHTGRPGTVSMKRGEVADFLAQCARLRG